MKCTKTHRKHLLEMLEKALETKDLTKKLLNERTDAQASDMIPWSEIDLWIINIQIEAIRIALIDNELENF